MPAHILRANAARATGRSAVEHVFAAQKSRTELVIRTIGIARAGAKLALANIAYNLTRFAWLERQTEPA
jgi:transposase, IS5 family